jgi:hypothetical protein
MPQPILGMIVMQKRKNVEKRNVVLKIETYARLDRYKIKRMNEKGDSSLSFDDVINDLLDKV